MKATGKAGSGRTFMLQEMAVGAIGGLHISAVTWVFILSLLGKNGRFGPILAVLAAASLVVGVLMGRRSIRAIQARKTAVLGSKVGHTSDGGVGERLLPLWDRELDDGI